MIGPLTPPEPQHTRAIACRDTAFRMDKLRRPLRLCKISGLYSIATLLPCCLRLALPVTRQHPRLANGGSLRFAVRVFHPPNYPPFSGRTFSKFTPHNVNSFPEPCVRLSRTRLFIITFTVVVIHLSAILSNFVSIYPPSLSTVNVSSERAL